MKEYAEFCCPTFIPAGKDENDFCIPKVCLEKLPVQEKYPSPNSCLPKKQLAEVKESIEETNQYLLNLALSDRYTNRQVWQMAFKGLKRRNVKVILDSEFAREVCGKVVMAGFDFVKLRDEEKDILVPYNPIIRLIVEDGSSEMPLHEPKLSAIEPCFRRELTFCFGNTVACSPELIQLFFGIPLAVYLLQSIDKPLVVLLEERRVEGILCSVTQDWLTILESGKEISVSLNNILALSVKEK